MACVETLGSIHLQYSLRARGSTYDLFGTWSCLSGKVLAKFVTVARERTSDQLAFSIRTPALEWQVCMSSMS